MINLFPLAGIKKVLFVGAHSDDIEIGCGGVLLELVKQRPDVEIIWSVWSADGERAREARASARSFLRGCMRSTILLEKFRGSYFPFEGAMIKERFEDLKQFQPDVIFTHYRDDRHQDHRVLSDLAWNTFRHHLILEYEIPKYDGDLGQPNFFIPLAASTAKRKVEKLMKYFRTQRSRHWFTQDLFLGFMRIRGMECVASTGYAEAFHCRKFAASFS